MGSMTMAAAAVAPVSLAELKANLRIATSEEDALLAGLARGAAETCEAFVGRLLIAREVEEMMPASTGWTRLGTGPVRSIASLAAVAADGAAESLPADAFAIDIDAAGEGWVRLLAPIDEKRVRVGYTAGLASDPNAVPEAIRQGIIRLVAHLYLHRGDQRGDPPPAAVTALWRPWRRIRIG